MGTQMKKDNRRRNESKEKETVKLSEIRGTKKIAMVT